MGFAFARIVHVEGGNLFYSAKSAAIHLGGLIALVVGATPTLSFAAEHRSN